MLSQDYKINMDWDGTRYLGLTLDWDYKLRKVHLTMPGYIKKACIRFGHTMPDKPQRQPHPHTLSIYGATIQYAKHIDQSPRPRRSNKNTFSKSLEYYSTTDGQSIPHSLWPSAHWRQCKRPQQNTLWNSSNGSSPTLQPTRTPSSHMKVVT